MFDQSLSMYGLRWLQEWNLETFFCNLQSWDDVNDGTYWIYAVGNDGCGARIALDSEYVYMMANDEAWGAYMTYLAKTIQQIRYRETVIDFKALLPAD